MRICWMAVTSAPLMPRMRLRMVGDAETVGADGVLYVTVLGIAVGTAAFVLLHKAMAARVFAPTTPQPVVAGEPEDTMPCACWYRCTARVSAMS